MKTYATRPARISRPRWPEPFARPIAKTAASDHQDLEAANAGNDFLIMNPRPDLTAPPPPPADLLFYSIDFP